MKYGKIIKGNVTIKKGNTDDFSAVKKITGYLSIDSNAKLEASQLQSVGGYLSIDSNAKLEALQSVGGYLYIDSNAKLEASQLQSVGGDLYIDSNAKLEALQSVGGYLSIDSNAKLEASANVKYNDEFAANNTRRLALEFNFNCFLKLGFLFADGILAKIINKKRNIYKIQICGKTEISYCIEVNGVYSHGKTIKEAKDSLIYKISNRDTSQYKDLTLDSKVSYEDAIKIYRCITGACEQGTRHFCETNLKRKQKEYTIKRIIEITKGQYGHNTFVNFFK